MSRQAAERLLIADPAHPPGTEGLWTFVFMDMVLFAMIFFTFMVERLKHVSMYSAAQAHLNDFFGLANTLILLTSSWLVVEAVQSARRQEAVRVRRLLGLAWLLGLAFCVNKAVEYYTKIHGGITPASNSFFSFYYFITFVHLLHVIAGMAFIAGFRARAPAQADTGRYLTGLENVGLFWHFVDVLWIFIFPMLYLVGRGS